MREYDYSTIRANVGGLGDDAEPRGCDAVQLRIDSEVVMVTPQHVMMPQATTALS